MRQVLSQRFHCKVTKICGQSKDVSKLPTIDISAGSEHKKSDHKIHPNLCEAFAILESDCAFFIVQTYSWYNLHDCVTFSPAKLTGSYAKPLFVVYQVLKGIQYSHQTGVSIGDLTLRDVLLDDKLWVKLTYPPINRTYTEICDKLKNQSEQLGVRFALSTTGEGDESRNSAFTDLQKVCHTFRDYTHENLPTLVQKWVNSDISNFEYLMVLNHLAGRRLGDPDNHPVLPWVMDFSSSNSGFRDLSKSKFRLNKGDRQLDLTYDTTSPFVGGGTMGGDNLQIPHHISDVLSDITYYVYKARCTPKSVLCAHVRSKWVPNEYPSSMQRMQEWTPDECIPEFFTDPTIFTSTHDDLPDLEVPPWASSATEFVQKHMSILEGEYVSQRLHQWIDLTFGYKVS